MQPDTKSVPLSARARLELASMAYARWSVAYDKLKEVKFLTWEASGRFCPKGEWPLYHAEMLKNAEHELTLATQIKGEICPHSPLLEAFAP
jgi:hypothetical protein